MSMKTRVWFNHWFSQMTHTFDSLRKSGKYWIMSTNFRDAPLMKMYPDHCGVEPKLHGDDYVDWSLDVIKEHRIEVFVPRLHRLAISDRIKEYEKIGCKVVVEDFVLEAILRDKADVYDWLKDGKFDDEDIKISELVPEYCVVERPEQFDKAYNKMKSRYGRVCIKKAIDEGAASFCELVSGDEIDYDCLMDVTYKTRKVNVDDYKRALKTQFKKEGRIDKLIMMGYLVNEVSCDCLMYGGNFICISREKVKNHTTYIRVSDEYTNICRAIYERLEFKGIVNMQFRHDPHRNIKLLEINPRISGGMYKSVFATGIDLADLVIQKYLGNEDITIYWPDLNELIKVGTEEKVSIIKD